MISRKRAIVLVAAVAAATTLLLCLRDRDPGGRRSKAWQWLFNCPPARGVASGSQA